MDEWADADDTKLREICQYRLRAHVRHQDGRDSLAPSLIFADADYEVGDGACGLHEDAKSANEPAIVYFRGDSLIDTAARIAKLENEVADLEAALTRTESNRDVAMEEAGIEYERAQKLEAENARLREFADLLYECQTAFLAAEISYHATPADRGRSNGPKGKSEKAVVRARESMMQAGEKYRADLDKG